MFEVRFEATYGVRWRAGWWAATIGAALIALGVVAAVIAPQVTQKDSDGVIYFSIGLAVATIGLIVFFVGRKLMFRRIVSRVSEENDSTEE